MIQWFLWNHVNVICHLLHCKPNLIFSQHCMQRTEIMTLFLLLIHCCCCGEVEIGDQGSTGQHRNESEDCPDFLAIVDAADKGLYGRVPDPISISLSKLGLFSSAISIMPCIISKDVLITSIMLIHSQAVGIGQPRPFTTSDSWNRLSENQSICSSQYLWDSQYFYKSK